MQLAATLTGYTEKAIRRKIEEGVWLEGHEYRRAPDGNLLIDMEAYEKWAEGQRRVGWTGPKNQDLSSPAYPSNPIIPQ